MAWSPQPPRATVLRIYLFLENVHLSEVYSIEPRAEKKAMCAPHPVLPLNDRIILTYLSYPTSKGWRALLAYTECFKSRTEAVLQLTD